MLVAGRPAAIRRRTDAGAITHRSLDDAVCGLRRRPLRVAIELRFWTFRLRTSADGGCVCGRRGSRGPSGLSDRIGFNGEIYINEKCGAARGQRRSQRQWSSVSGPSKRSAVRNQRSAVAVSGNLHGKQRDTELFESLWSGVHVATKAAGCSRVRLG